MTASMRLDELLARFYDEQRGMISENTVSRYGTTTRDLVIIAAAVFLLTLALSVREV